MTHLPPDDPSPESKVASIGDVGISKKALHGVFSFPVFLGAMVVVCAVTMTVWDHAPVIGGKVFVEGDTWWHIAVGERILSSHTWPTRDGYSFTVSGSPWIAYEWLGEIVLAFVARWGGLPGITALLVLLGAAIGLLIYYLSWLRCGNCKAAAVATILVLPVAAATFTMRPQMMGYILLLVTLICLERYQQGQSRALWILPIVFLVWVNTHSSFSLGLLVLGVYWMAGLFEFRVGFLEASRRPAGKSRHLLWMTFLCLAAVMITPYGPRLALYPVEVVLRQRFITSVATEWQTLQLSAPYAQVFLALLLGLFLVQIVSPATYRIEALALLLFAIVETFIHARFVMFSAVILAPILSTVVSKWLPPYVRSRDHPIVNAAFIVVILVSLLELFPSAAKLQKNLAANYPVGAVQYLRSHPEVGPMFNTDSWGSYLIWAIPGRKVFIDGRYDIYEYGGVLSDYVNLIHLREDPDHGMQKYGLRAVLLSPGNDLEKYFENSPAWRNVYRDSTSVIFVLEKSPDSGGVTTITAPK